MESLDASREPSGYRRFAGAFAMSALVMLTGCDTIRARFRAREGVDLYKAGSYSSAAAKFEEASRLDPSLPILALNAGTSNLAHFRAVGSKTPEGQEAASRAIASYKRYLELRPDDTRVKAALVQTFVETGRYEDAVVFFRPATEKSPPDIEALSTLATVAAKCGKPDDAERWHRRRIEAAPDKAEGYLAFGIFVWQELHDHPQWPHDKRQQKAEAAIEALKKAIDLQPAAPNAYTYTNLVYRELAASEPTEEGKRKHLEEANHYFKMAVERQNKAG
jgi:tetratricopeptide (TPR) repeat protein